LLNTTQGLMIMKTFTEYLTEAADKTYDFKIKTCCELDKDKLDAMENVLKAYDMVSMSKPKRLPIKEHPGEFPNKGPIEVHVVEASVKMPVTPPQIKEMMKQRAGINEADILVYTKGQDESYVADQGAEADGALLEKDYDKSDNSEHGTEKFKNSMLKDLESSIKHEYADPNTEKGKTTNDLPMGDKSPMGSTANKKPTPKSSAR
jgi:hypothetical protein